MDNIMTRTEYAKLTDEEKRTKIAELCGWSEIRQPENDMERMFCDVCNGDLIGKNKNPKMIVVPDYLNDLNAMHKVEEYPTLQVTNGSRSEYLRHLSECTSGKCVFATSAQRAQAFVLTMTKEN